VRWEDTDEESLSLGKGEHGLLRFGEFVTHGQVREVRFFPIPKHRHLPGSYHPTQPYPIAADELKFELCVRTEADLRLVRSAQIAFAPDGEPLLSFAEPGRKR
jgi:hypothetical protein